MQDVLLCTVRLYETQDASIDDAFQDTGFGEPSIFGFTKVATWFSRKIPLIVLQQPAIDLNGIVQSQREQFQFGSSCPTSLSLKALVKQDIVAGRDARPNREVQRRSRGTIGKRHRKRPA